MTSLDKSLIYLVLTAPSSNLKHRHTPDQREGFLVGFFCQLGRLTPPNPLLFHKNKRGNATLPLGGDLRSRVVWERGLGKYIIQVVAFFYYQADQILIGL